MASLHPSHPRVLGLALVACVACGPGTGADDDASGEASFTTGSAGSSFEASSEASTSDASATDASTSSASSSSTASDASDTATDDATDTATDTASSTDTTTTGPLLDVDPTGTATATTTDGGDDSCKKVDILFAIDTSGSMGDEQGAITTALPQFANEMIATLDTVESLHIGVVASGPYTGNDPSSCAVSGALVARSSCLPFAGGQRFITEADNIASAFPCNAALGLGGPGDNTTMQNIIGGVTSLQGAGECNEGFIRPDALLVIVILTDEEDDHDNPPGFGYYGSPGDPADWYNQILNAKFGIESNVVVRAIVQPPDINSCPDSNNTTLKEWFDANRIIEFTNLWTNGAVGDICDTASYGTYLAETLSVIDSACDGFVPPQ